MNTPPDPIDYGIRPEDNRVGHRAAVALSFVFVLLISLPAVLREVSGDSVRGALARIGAWSDGTVVERLRAVEKRVDDGAWTHPIRQQIQSALYQGFGEGNRKVVVGRDGWLFHRPGIRALTGRGPVLGPAPTSAKGHQAVEAWDGPIAVIEEFAAQLQERGIQLVLVPVPDKAATTATQHLSPPTLVALEKCAWEARRLLTGGGGILNPPTEPWRMRFDIAVMRGISHVLGQHRPIHPDAASLYDRLERSILVCSLAPTGPSLRTDTHWNGTRIRQTSDLLATEIDFRATLPPATSSATPAPPVPQSIESVGDLALALALRPSLLPSFKETATGQVTTPVASDPTSSVVLLGDSNVNMFDDPALPFHLPGAGFGSWLAASLARPLHVIAINGGGATAVRQRFAALPDDLVRAKKLVIWVIAERDLFMDPAVARENGVEWKRVTFNPIQSGAPDELPADAVVAEVTLQTKSALQDPAQANYPDALYVAECTVDRVTAGTYGLGEMAVVLWNFRHDVVQPSAAFVPGQKLRVTVVPFDHTGDLTKTNLSNDLLRFDLPLMYAEKAERR